MRTSVLVLAALLAASAPAVTACKGRGGAAAAATPANPKDAQFLADNAKQPGVVTLPSGLQYKIVHSGPTSGPHPKAGDEVKVMYEGTLTDGTVFDSTFKSGQPAVLELDGLVQGWQEALPLMRPGDEWFLYIPAKLGYGDSGAGGVIPPGATLIFRMQLLGVLSHGDEKLG
jgi:FKBP-type peptidyl-prolyl cis-trans isomerase